MSRLNVETLRTPSLPDPILASVPAETASGGNDSFETLLERAHDALNDAPASFSPDVNDSSPDDSRADEDPQARNSPEPADTPDAVFHESQPAADCATGQQKSPAPNTDTPKPTAESEETAAAHEKANSPHCTPQHAQPKSTDNPAAIDATGEDKSRDQNTDSTEHKSEGEPRNADELTSLKQPTGDAQLTSDSTGTTDRDHTHRAAQSPNPTAVPENSPTTTTDIPQTAHEVSQTAETQSTKVLEVKVENHQGASDSANQNEGRKSGRNSAAKNARASGGRQAKAVADARPSQTTGQNDAQPTAAVPQTAPIPAQLAAALPAAGDDDGHAAKAQSDKPATLDADGIRRAAPERPSPQSGTHQPQDSPAATQADRVRFVQRVARAFDSVGDRGGTIRLRLHPPELGSLRLEVTVRNGAMNARLEAETQSAQKMLLENLPALRERLAEQNIRVERFDVELMNQSSGGATDGSGTQAQSRQGQQQHRPPYNNNQPETRVEAVAGLRQSITAGGASRFDVIA